MNSDALTLVLIFGILFLVLLIVIFYLALFFKPGKRLKVTSNLNMDPDLEDFDNQGISVQIENIGTKSVKIVYPFVKFRRGRFSRLFQARPERVNASFPKILKPGSVYDFIIDISSYRRIMRKKSFSPDSVKVIIKDTIGVKFQSESHILK